MQGHHLQKVWGKAGYNVKTKKRKGGDLQSEPVSGRGRRWRGQDIKK